MIGHDQPTQQLPATDAEDTLWRAGDVTREARKARNLTLSALAELTGVSVSMLSMLERGVASPSIGTLVSVTSALGLHMTDLFEPVFDTSGNPIRRRQDQPVFKTAEGVMRRIVHTDVSRGIEVAVNEYQPSTSSANHPVHHSGVEFGVVVSGTLILTLDEEDYTLNPGDGISYQSKVPHRFRNVSNKPAQTVWVNLDA